jgi:heme exporter protein C
MKFVLMFGAVIIGILMGYFPSINKPKPMWWKLMVFIAVAAGLIFTILPPIAGSWNSTFYLKQGMYEEIDIELSVKDISKIENGSLVTVETSIPHNQFFIEGELPNEFKKGNDLIITLSYDSLAPAPFVYHKTKSKSAAFTYPFVPNLYERIKILNLHVPMAWVAVIAYMVSMIYSIRYLKSKDFDFDDKAVSAAALGTLFAILATVTGMLWAKYNWGRYWNWDPRQTSIFVLILIYAAYFALRAAIDNDESKARLSSVYSIFAFVTVPFLVFILPRLSTGLHPGSADDVNAGPVVSSEKGSLDSNLMYSFGVALFAFTTVFFWMLNIQIRQRRLERKFVSYSTENN